MPVVGFTITHIEGRREKDVQPTKMAVNSAPGIKAIKEVDLPAIGKKVLQIDFDFITTYSPDIGFIKIAGELLYMSEDNPKLLDSWNKAKNIPAENSLEILNFLFRKSILKMINLSDDLQLPPPINLPFVGPPEENQIPKETKIEKTEEKEKGGKEKEIDKQEKELEEKIKKLTSK